MSLSPKQTARYWREWGAVCAEQGWTGAQREERRRAVHKQARCPHSMREFDNRAFDRFLAECAALQNKVDIRDRERERVEFVIERLDDAIHAITGKHYARAIVRDMNDRESTDALPLDPIADQVERGDATFNARKYGKRKFRAGFDHAHADLSNLRDTLKNRLSSLLTQIKAGKIECPACLAWALPCANNAATDAIGAGKIAIRRTNGRAVWYDHVTATEYARMQRERTAPAPAAQREGEAPAEPTSNPSRARSGARFVPAGIFDDEADDDDTPF